MENSTDRHYLECPFCGVSGYKYQVALQALERIRAQDITHSSGALLKMQAEIALNKIEMIDYENRPRG